MFLLVIGGAWFYLSSNYLRLDASVKLIKLVLEKPLKSNTPVAYILDSTQVQLELRNHLDLNRVNDSVFLLSFKKAIKLRQFRIYFSPSDEIIRINSILMQSNKDVTLSLDKFRAEKLDVIERKASLSFKVLSGQGYSYIESTRFVYPSDSIPIILSTIGLMLLSYLLIRSIIKFKLLHALNSMTLTDLSVFVFVLSIFLPQAFFNISLVVSLLLLIRNFSFQLFLSNRLNLIFILFYIGIIFNFLFISTDFNFRAIEKYLLFLALPIYASCIRNERVLDFFWISALMIGVVLLALAAINISIFRNIDVVSFRNFTGIIHPVYYSYLLTFSIVHIELNVLTKGKYLIHGVLILLLILSGSKLILFVTLLWYTFFVSKKLGFAFLIVVLISLVVFPPIKERFKSVLSRHDLPIIGEKKIKNPDDPRLNGFTLRLIFWQENFNFNSFKEFAFGRGVSKLGAKSLEDNLRKRGLTNHLEYNAHNQYLTTLFRTGLVGFLMLLLMLFYCLKQGIMTSNKELVYFTLLMSFAMFTESVFERVFGIAFFCLVLLMLLNLKSTSPKGITLSAKNP